MRRDWSRTNAVGTVGDVRLHTVVRGTRIVSEALMAECTNPHPRLVEPRLAGISSLALGIEGFEEIMRGGATVSLRQCWLCRQPR